MKKEDFFELLNELDDGLVKEAKETVKRKPNRPVWAAAACLALILTAGALLLASRQTAEHRTADAAPMVYVNDTLYKQSSDQQGYPELKEDFVYLGKITSEVSNDQSNTDGTPKENFQANHRILGCEVYQYGENIVIKINNAYWLYTKYGQKEVTWPDLTETEKHQSDPNYK